MRGTRGSSGPSGDGTETEINPTGDGITVGGDGSAANPYDIDISLAANSLLEISGGKLRVAQAAAGLGLAGGGGAALDVNVAAAGGIEIIADAVKVKAFLLSDNKMGTPIVDGAASSATAERAILINKTGVVLTVTAVWLVNNVSFAGNDTNNFVVNIFRRSAGVGSTIVTYTNNVASGGVTAWVPKDLGAVANNTLADGDVVTFSVTKNGTGNALVANLLLVITWPG